MNIGSVIITEPKNVDNFFPFSAMHPVYELRCGAFRMFERLQRQLPHANFHFSGEGLKKNSFLKRFGIDEKEISKTGTLVVLSTALLTQDNLAQMEQSYIEYTHSIGYNTTVVFVHRNMVFAAFIPENERINPGKADLDFLPKMLSELNNIIHGIEINDVVILDYIWDSIYSNEKLLKNDFELFGSTHIELQNVLNPENVFIGEKCNISHTTILDASEGPIIIGNNVTIMHYATLIGPCFVGDNSLVKVGAKIYESCSFGEYCKIGGEIENSIIQSYSNKQHEGFLGHSFLSEWVNIGADTNTSDLKNTYTNITVQLKDREIDTGNMFLGFICGDHTKTAINTQLNTGSIAGICGILVKEGFLPKFIPSFSWGGGKNSPSYKASKAISVARTVMARRNKSLLPEEEELINTEQKQGQ